jgi:photosynthetic reaction center M subunit
MADYQNLFTAVQVAGPVHHGTELHDSTVERTGKPFLLHLAGRMAMRRLVRFISALSASCR